MALLLKLLVFLFIIIVPCVTPLSFNFDSFSPNSQNITYEGDATPANGAIQLTTNQRDRSSNGSTGRATYSQPLHLWDNATGNVTDFTTHFSFTIDSEGRTRYADGISFFLAPAGSRMPDTIEGSSLGLTSLGQQLNTSNNNFVAVEFDTFRNFFDPVGDHVGIDINSLQSVVNVTWFSSIPNRRRNDAWISYNSTTENLSVVFTGFRNNATVMQNLSFKLDLREHLPERVTFGFTGATGDLFALQSIHSWNFTSSLEIKDNVTDPGVVLPNPEPENAPSKSKLGLVIGLAIGGCVLVVVCGLTFFVFWRKWKSREENDDDDDVDVFDGSMNDEFERNTGPKKFLYSELASCTNNFSREDKLGEGGFGGVYKGYIRESDSFVAVKRVSRGSKQGIKEYASEVRIISRLRHRNLVQLIGWCHEKRELLLVYEFMPNGSLDSHLFKGKSHLTWSTRFKIAQGLASALLYLHEEWEQCVVHRDIKSSNIMLDSNFNAKLGDFGLARLVDHDKGSQTTVLAGTMGYMAPECLTTGRASKETDVYSFGVVMLEIACGRKPIDPRAEEYQVNIVDWVWRLYGTGNLSDAVDSKISSDFNEKEMEHLLVVGLWCAHPDSNCRPSIRQAIHVLNFEAPLPVLPPNMPVPTYGSPSQHLLTTSLSSTYQYTGSSNNTAASATSSSSASLLHVH